MRLLFTVFFLSIQYLYAQVPDLYFENYNSEQGLSQNSVTCFAQDEYGFIWIGTENGLNKFNGYQISNYFEDSNNPNSLSSNAILDIVTDSANRLWIATADGLNCYDQKTEKFYHIKLTDSISLNNQRINITFIDTKNYLWLATPHGLKKSKSPILHLSNPEKIIFQDLELLSNKNIAFIYEDSKKNIWIADSKEIYIIQNNNRITKIKIPDIYANNNDFQITSIAEDKKMRFWIGTNQGLIWYNKKLESYTFLKYHPFFKAHPKANNIKSILVDHKGSVFVGTYQNGLLQFVEKENSFIAYNNSEYNCKPLPKNYIYTLFEDKSKVLFVSLIGSGFSKANLNTKKFQLYKNQNFKNNYKIRVLYASDNNNLWIGLQNNGLERLNINTNTYTNYLSSDFNEGISVKSICKYDSVNLILGTLSKGIVLFNIKTGKYRQFASEMPKLSKINYITDIKIDKQKKIWIASNYEGIYVYNPPKKSITHYHTQNKKNTLFSNNISSINFDDKGMVWITSLGGGLGILNPLTNKIKHYIKNTEKKGSIPSNTTTVSISDDAKNMWIGCSDGLCKYIPENDSFELFNYKNGLADNLIYAIQKDSKGNLWVSTNKGISFFNTKTKTFINFNKKDGLQGDEFNLSASCIFPDGRIAFGGLNGFNIFIPDSIKPDSFVPKVNIYKFQLFNKNVKPNQLVNNKLILKNSILSSSKIILDYSNNFIGFEFSAQDYSKPKTIKYQYILEGFDKNWNTASYKYRKATYTNLQPGTYIFKVRSTNSDGIFQQNTKSIKITILPPFWKTSWFYIIVGLLAVVIPTLIIYLSNKWIFEQNKKLEKIAEQRTLALEEKNIALADKVTQINKQKIELQEKTEALTILNTDLEIFSTVVNEMRNTLLIMDAKGNFLFANKAFNETYMQLDDLKERFGNNIFNVPVEKHILKIIKRCFNEKVSVQFEAEYTKILGEKFWVHSNMTPILDKNKQIKNVILIETNITEIKQRENQILKLAEELYKKSEDLDNKNKELEAKNRKIMEQSQEMKSLTENLESANKNLEEIIQERTRDMRIAKEQAQKADQLKTMFLLNLSHEIRTPMNAICGFSELMADERADLNKRKKYAQFINENVDALLQLIDNIMDLSKLQAKQIKLNNQEFKVKQKLTEIYHLYIVDDEKIKENVFFKLNIDSIEHISVKADLKKFEKIFTNLIDNAIKYTEKGSIELAAHTDENNKNLYISVIDTGIGIKKEEISNIFEYFRKIDDNIKLYRGTGLGLSIVREILNIYNWDIKVESKLGKGSTFKVIIPLS